MSSPSPEPDLRSQEGTEHLHAGKRNALIGSPVERLEDLRFLRGRGQFVDDVHASRVLHAVILRSQVAHGRIRGIDVSAARARPGVAAVITAADLVNVPLIPMRQELLPEFAPYQQPVIACGKVRYVGEPLAVVVADSPAIAEDALGAIDVDIEPLSAVSDRARARQSGSLLFESSGTNHVITLTASRSEDTDAVFARAPYVRRERFSVQRFTAVMMEPRGLMADWDKEAGRLTVYGATKVPFHNRRILAKQIGLAEQSISMVECDVGGGFGVRGEFYPEDFLIPYLARRLGRAGEVGGGPPRASRCQQPRPRRRMRTGNRLRTRWHHPELARPCGGRYRRLYPHQWRDRGPQHRADSVRSVPHPAHPRRHRPAGH